MAMKKEALTNLIADDLAKRNENWTEIDTTFELKADKTYVDNQNAALTAQLADIDQRIDNVITTPAVGVSEQEILDARQGEGSLGTNILKIKNKAQVSFAPSVQSPREPVSKTISTFQADHGWANPIQGGVVGISNDINDYFLGNQSVKILSTAQKNGLALNLVNKIITMKVKVNYCPENVNLYLYMSNSSSLSSYKSWVFYRGTDNSRHFPVGEWVTINFPAEYVGGTGAVDLSNISTLRIRAFGGEADFNVQYIGYRDNPQTKPIVTFCFDDGWSSQMLGADILAQKGIPATLFCIPNTVGAANYITLPQLKKLQDVYRWDIESHGATIYTGMTAEQIITEWQNTKMFFTENGLGRGDHMAYPGGQNNTEIADLAKKYFTSARTISGNTHVETYPPAQPMRLRALSAISSAAGGVSIANTKLEIDRAVASKTWLLLVFHRVGAVTTSMDISPTDLADIADYVIASGADIKTVADVFAQ